MKAFTLVELLIVIAIVAIIGVLAVPLYNTFQISNQLDTYSSEAVQVLRRAQMKTINLEADSQWGVYFDEDVGGNDDKFVLFKGSTYTGRDETYDEITELPNTLSLVEISLNGGGDEVVFEKITGATSQYGSLKIRTVNNDEKTITINQVGQASLD